RNDVKARTTLLLALPDEHQLRFNKLQAIVSHLEFMDVKIKQHDLNQKILTSLAPEWLMYTIVWRNRDDLDTMILDDVYTHLKVYEPEVQKKSESNSQNMAFISSSNTSSGKGKVHTASIPTASTQVSTASTDVAAASLIIEFGDSYKAPPKESSKGLTSKSSAKKKGRTVVITTEDMQKKRNDVKARTTLLLALPDEHQLRFNKYEATKELWEAILKTLVEMKPPKRQRRIS
nr:hypothetical protein [Tanacetum cinerariifolium]